MKKLKILLILLLAASLVGCSSTSSSSSEAESENASKTATVEPGTQQEETHEPVTLAPREPEMLSDAEGYVCNSSDLRTYSDAFCVVDADGNVVAGKNIYEPYAPASVTKVMTALVVCERVSIDNEVVIMEEAVRDHLGIFSSGVRPSFRTGEKVTVEDLLYALILPSTNAAGNILAFHVADGIENFAKLMNRKLDSLGLYHSHFMNPHGMDEEGHYVCAYDMAIIMKAACENETLRKILSSSGYRIPETEYVASRAVYPSSGIQNITCVSGVFAAKPGSTAKAGSTLVTAVSRNKETYYISTLHATQGYANVDTENIIGYVYAKSAGTEYSVKPFAHRIRIAAETNDSVTVSYRVEYDAKNVRVVYWDAKAGTGTAVYATGCPDGRDCVFTIHPSHFGPYILQVFAEAADGTESVVAVTFLFDGKVNEKGFAELNGEKYIVGDGGLLRTGAVETEDGCYMTLNSGPIAYGFVGSGFFAGKDGKVVTGWITYGGAKYYFQGDGRMATGRFLIDGKLYEFAEDGRLITE